MKKIKCKVCGKRFTYKKENRYEVIKNNLGHQLLRINTVLECFDCPKCGCQNIVNIRELSNDR